MPFPYRPHWSARKIALIAASFLSLTILNGAKSASDQVINNSKSLVVETLNQDRTCYKLRLRSTSTVAVFSSAISVTNSKGICDLHTPRSIVGPFIGTNKAREIHLVFPRSAPSWSGPAGESCSSAADSVVPRQSRIAPGIVIVAVDFEDGTCEGDREKCAMLEAVRLGVVAQYRRIAALVEEEMSSGQQAPWLDALTLQASALSDVPEPAIVDSIQTQFKQPSGINKQIWLDLQSGLLWEKQFFLNDLKLYALESAKYGKPIVSLRDWWGTTKGQCDFYSPQLCS